MGYVSSKVKKSYGATCRAKFALKVSKNFLKAANRSSYHLSARVSSSSNMVIKLLKNTVTPVKILKI